MNRKDDGMWFAPKRYGFGAGLPIAWQGWALLGSYLAVVLGASLFSESHLWPLRAASFAIILGATITLLVIMVRRTRGGWKWRWGGGD